MAKIVLAEALAEDFSRIFESIAERDPGAAIARIATMTDAIDVLEKHPLIGRPVESGPLLTFDERAARLPNVELLGT